MQFNPKVSRPFARLASCYLVYGSEDALKPMAIAAMRREALDESYADFDFQELDFGDFSANEVLAAASQVPFGSNRRLVVATGAEKLRSSQRSSELDELAVGIPKLGQRACLVLVVGANEERRRGDSILSRKLDESVKAINGLVECVRLRTEELRQWLEAAAETGRKRLEPAAISTLIVRSGSTLSSLQQHWQKLEWYTAGRPLVTVNDVEATAVYSPEDQLLKYTDAIGHRNAEEALRRLSETQQYDSGPGMAARAIVLLGRTLSLLWQARIVETHNKQPTETPVDSMLPREPRLTSQHKYVQQIYFQQCKKWRFQDLVKAYDATLRADYAIKTGADATRVLQLLTIELCRIK